MDDRQPLIPKRASLSIEVTTNCNSSCSHCFVRARGARKVSLTNDIVHRILSEGYLEGYRNLHITGGEPLMWDGLRRLLEFAFATGYETAFLNTNGTLLSAKLSRELAAFSGLTISVSIQGPKRLHDNLRGQGSYELALKGVENALIAGIPVHIFTPVGKSLIQELPLFATSVIQKYGAIEVLHLIQLIRVPQDVFDLSKEVLEPQDFINLVRMVALLNLAGLKIDLLRNPLANVASRILEMNWLPSSAPLYEYGSIMVTAEGRMTLAHSTTEDFGSYEPGILSTILNSSKYCRALSDGRLICRRCAYSSICSLEGMSKPSEWNRDMAHHSPYCKRVLDLASSVM